MAPETASASGIVQPSAALAMPTQSSGSVRLSGSSVVSQSMPARATRAAQKPHQSNATGCAPKRQAASANSAPVASSTIG
jgi:hypothetical protein